jgi:cysteine-rich repeat protein
MGLVVGACSPGAFECTDDAQCVAAGRAGACEPDGWCSFPADDCPSGSRYGEHAGDGKGGTCVGGGDSSGVAETGATTPSTTEPPTTDTTAGTTGTSATTTASDTSTTTMTTTSVDSSDSADPLCGNEIVDDGEECDDGNADEDDGCTTLCSMPFCGDGIKQQDETCDMNAVGTTSCATFGLVDGTLGCSRDCDAFDRSQCQPCKGNDCSPYSLCENAMFCLDGSCVSIGDGPGTCFPSCARDCPDGGYCTMTFNACGIACLFDTDCPAGMTCTALPGNERACMW